MLASAIRLPDGEVAVRGAVGDEFMVQDFLSIVLFWIIYFLPLQEDASLLFNSGLCYIRCL